MLAGIVEPCRSGPGTWLMATAPVPIRSQPAGTRRPPGGSTVVALTSAGAIHFFQDLAAFLGMNQRTASNLSNLLLGRRKRYRGFIERLTGCLSKGAARVHQNPVLGHDVSAL